MFAYCNNNPVNAKDPSGHALTRVAIYDDLTVNIFFGSGGGGGGGSGYALVGAGGVASSLSKVKKVINNTSEAVVERDLQSNGFAFYKGIPVFSTDLLPGTSAFSFGGIVLGEGNINHIDFEYTLNHEYGHAVHFRQIGAGDYFLTTALPSLTGAALYNDNKWIKANYYSLPWERVANYFGGVNTEYLPWADSTGSFFWLATLMISSITPW